MRLGPIQLNLDRQAIAWVTGVVLLLQFSGVLRTVHMLTEHRHEYTHVDACAGGHHEDASGRDGKAPRDKPEPCEDECQLCVVLASVVATPVAGGAGAPCFSPESGDLIWTPVSVAVKRHIGAQRARDPPKRA